jgi:5-formyltetrahydrofolate cyclo-ligase
MDPGIKQWRREQRAVLLARRDALTSEDRKHAAKVIGSKLDGLVATRGCEAIGLFWPIKLEINLLPWAHALEQRIGATLCLPVVVARNEPLEYRRWSQGEPLARGIWDIPVPEARDVIVPDLMLAPMVGFDRANYRLGYGGGYFDRTLASLSRRPFVVGIGYEFSAQDTIFPQPHDIPMDLVLTEHQ